MERVKVEQLDWSKLKTPTSEYVPKSHFKMGAEDIKKSKAFNQKKKEKSGNPIIPAFACSECHEDCLSRAKLKEHWTLEH